MARIYDPGRAEVYQRLGIPTVATVRWTADQMLRRLLPQGHVPEHTDPAARSSSPRCRCHPSWIGRPLTEIEEAPAAALAFLTRLGEGIIPGKDMVYQDGDLVHLVRPAPRPPSSALDQPPPPAHRQAKGHPPCVLSSPEPAASGVHRP